MAVFLCVLQEKCVLHSVVGGKRQAQFNFSGLTTLRDENAFQTSNSFQVELRLTLFGTNKHVENHNV